MNPIRDIPVVFVASSTSTVPFPLPDAPLGNIIHDTVDDALQVHPWGAVTLIVCVPPATFRLTGDTMTLQIAPAWVTCTALSAMVSVADRGEDEGLAATVRPTMPAPDPPPVLNVIHETGDWLVQEQPSPAEMNTVAFALLPFTLTAVGDVE